MKLKLSLLSLILSASLVGCSNQWREADGGVDDGYIFSIYDEILMLGGLSNSQLSGDLREDPYSSVYFSESTNESPAESVMSFNDLSFLSQALGIQIPIGTNSFQLGLPYVAVIFVDAMARDGGRHFELLIKMGTSQTDNVRYYSATSTKYKFTRDKFEVDVIDNMGTTLRLKSFDVSPDYKDELAANIKLKVCLLENNGTERPIGQFSTMAGFGGY